MPFDFSPRTLLARFLFVAPFLVAAGLARPATAQDWRSFRIEESDRASEPAIPWQRSLDDALRLSAETGKPLLIAVCIDGESASEVFAHRLYKDPSFAELVRGFVPIVFSPDRHNERDHDERGARIVCPRFGSVTCGEHAADEPEAYRRWFGGVRYSPRHVGIAPDGETVLFDRYLDQDLGRVRRALERFGRPLGTLAARLDRVDARSRAELERAYLDGSPSFRVEVLRALPEADAEHAELLRIALGSGDPNERYYAKAALARAAGPASAALLIELLNDGRGGVFATDLRARLDALAPTVPTCARARRVAIALEETARLAPELNRESWLRRLRHAPTHEAPDESALVARLEALARELDARPEAADLELEMATTTLELARRRLAHGASPGFLFQDAREAAARARGAGAFPEEVAVREAQAAYMLGELDQAVQLALDALPALRTTRVAASGEAAHVLAVLADSRARALYATDAAGDEWPTQWLAEAHAAGAILAVHPAGEEKHAVAHADLLSYFGARAALDGQLRTALERWPSSAELHARLRSRILARDGALGLERGYLAEAAHIGDPAAFAWFHGYATLMTAEELVRRDRRDEAAATYGRALARFDESARLEPSYAPSAAGYGALARVGAARLCWDDEPARAVELLVAAFASSPECGAWTDGLGTTPIDALRQLRVRVKRREDATLGQALEEGVRAHAPAAWEESDRLPGARPPGE